jgi:hypothetical protein
MDPTDLVPHAWKREKIVGRYQEMRDELEVEKQ